MADLPAWSCCAARECADGGPPLHRGRGEGDAPKVLWKCQRTRRHVPTVLACPAVAVQAPSPVPWLPQADLRLQLRPLEKLSSCKLVSPHHQQISAHPILCNRLRWSPVATACAYTAACSAPQSRAWPSWAAALPPAAPLLGSPPACRQGLAGASRSASQLALPPASGRPVLIKTTRVVGHMRGATATCRHI
jgi:hypothetical protein